MFQKNSFPASLFSRSRQVSQTITRTFHETRTKKSSKALRPDTGPFPRSESFGKVTNFMVSPYIRSPPATTSHRQPPSHHQPPATSHRLARKKCIWISNLFPAMQLCHRSQSFLPAPPATTGHQPPANNHWPPGIGRILVNRPS